MAVAWAHQDCSRPLNLIEQWDEKIRQLRGQLTDSKKKLAAREEKLKNNTIDLVARTEGRRGPKLRSGCSRGSSPGST